MPARRSRSASVLDRRRSAGHAGRRSTPGFQLDEHRRSPAARRRGRDRYRAGRSPGDRWLQRHHRHRQPGRSTTTTSPSTASTARFDDSLRTGPYNFGFLDNPLLQNWVEHFPYQDGLLVWYWDTSVQRQQRRRPSGRAALILPVDAHPAASALRPTERVDARRGSSRTTRRSASSRPTRSRCTRTACRR